MTLNRISYAARTPGVAQAPDPGSTCTNSFNPLSTTCETWLSRYAFPGSSDDKAAAAAISPDGSRVFVTGFSGEQYAVPEAVEALRAVRKQERTGETIAVSAADPLNLVGIVLPGPRVPALVTNTVTYVDGVPEDAMPAFA